MFTPNLQLNTKYTLINTYLIYYISNRLLLQQLCPTNIEEKKSTKFVTID